MSIRDEINQLWKKDKVLHAFRPNSRRPAKRRVFLTPRALKELNDPNSAVNLLVGKGYIEAALTRWVLGDLVFARDGRRKGGFLKELEPPPPDVWEIRVTEPSAQARLFGLFAERDTLILTNFHTRAFLGDKGSQAWKQAMTTAVESWKGLFQNQPMHADSIKDYVSENVEEFPLERDAQGK